MPDDVNAQPGPDPLYTHEPEDASPNPLNLIAALVILRRRKFRNYTIALGAAAAGAILAVKLPPGGFD